MDQYQLGVAFAAAHLAELHGQADRRRQASRNRRVQQEEEATLREARGWARAARRRASVALWSSGAAILLAAIALLTR
jgi:hypothetical protein